MGNDLYDRPWQQQGNGEIEKSKDLERAAEEIREGKVSVREAAAKYCIPKSMVHDHSKLEG